MISRHRVTKCKIFKLNVFLLVVYAQLFFYYYLTFLLVKQTTPMLNFIIDILNKTFVVLVINRHLISYRNVMKVF